MTNDLRKRMAWDTFAYVFLVEFKKEKKSICKYFFFLGSFCYSFASILFVKFSYVDIAFVQKHLLHFKELVCNGFNE